MTFKDLRFNVLLHETRFDVAKAIMNTNFRKGKGGVMGGGVYFAENKDACGRKAHQRGSYVVSLVKLGRLLEIYDYKFDLNKENINRLQYDSVRGYKSTAPDSYVFNTGPEYCVFEEDRIKPLFAEINENGRIYYMFKTNSGVINIDRIDVDELVIQVTDKKITVGNNTGVVYTEININEPLLKDVKIVFTHDSGFEFTKIIQKIK